MRDHPFLSADRYNPVSYTHLDVYKRQVKVLLHRELKKNNVDIKAIDRPNYSIYTQNPNEIFVNGMFELLDVYERLEIALKLKRGRLQKAKGGGYAGGGAPFGYESLRGGKKLYVNATEAKAVRRVFEIKQSFPDMTLKSIAEFMKMEGPVSYTHLDVYKRQAMCWIRTRRSKI